MKVAIFAQPASMIDHLTNEFPTLWTQVMDKASGFVRVTEYAEVPFILRNHEETLKEELAALDVMASKIKADAALELQAVETKRQELLAIGYAPASASPEDEVAFA